MSRGKKRFTAAANHCIIGKIGKTNALNWMTDLTPIEERIASHQKRKKAFALP
jgi:hypothetical protein